MRGSWATPCGATRPCLRGRTASRRPGASSLRSWRRRRPFTSTSQAPGGRPRRHACPAARMVGTTHSPRPCDRPMRKRNTTMKVLVIDVGGTNVKILATGQQERRTTPSGPDFTPADLVRDVVPLADGWDYGVVSIGYPGLVIHGKPRVAPYNLGSGRVGFDYAAAFGKPVKILNDAAMQALGSY